MLFRSMLHCAHARAKRKTLYGSDREWCGLQRTGRAPIRTSGGNCVQPRFNLFYEQGWVARVGRDIKNGIYPRTYAEIHKDDFLKKAVKKDDPYEEIARRVPSETADEIRRAKFPGVELYSEKWRFYPANKVASDVLGIVAFKDKTLAGRYWLEKYYDDVLVRDESDLYSNFFAEIFSNVRELGKGKPLEGDLVTTIEPNVSLFLERELGKVVDTWGAKQAGGIVMDPYTGEIVSLIEHPSFDPNNFKEETTRVFGNALVEDVYEMGSIIKPLTIAAGLDSGAITAKTKYNDEGQMTIDNATISNFDGKARGTVNMQEVLNQSLNTGAVFAVNRMGKDKFRSYMKPFGLGEETGVDLPNETAGIID